MDEQPGMNEQAGTFVRLLAALAVLGSGVLHLKIWNSQYKGDLLPSSFPGAWVVKTGFPAQAAVCVALVALLLFVRRPIVWVAALLVQVGSVAALVLSREASIFGWKEPVWNSDAKQVLGVEVVAVLALIVLFILDYQRIADENELQTL